MVVLELEQPVVMLDAAIVVPEVAVEAQLLAVPELRLAVRAVRRAATLLVAAEYDHAAALLLDHMVVELLLCSAVPLQQ